MDPAKKRAVLEKQLQDANKLAGSKLKTEKKHKGTWWIFFLEDLLPFNVLRDPPQASQGAKTERQQQL